MWIFNPARAREICARVGPALVEQGILFAGLDVIGGWLTEVNVTSPTGVREINALDGVTLEAAVLDVVERRWAARRCCRWRRRAGTRPAAAGRGSRSWAPGSPA